MGLASSNWLQQINQQLDNSSAIERIEFMLEKVPGNAALASSFGAQSAVSLHMVTQVMPEIPVILIDTGYLFPETYQFIDELRSKLNLNLKVYRNELSPAWQEARYGQQWQQGKSGIEAYNLRNKVEPMDRALEELQTEVWFSGLRRQQAKSREQLPVVQAFKGRLKVHPIIDWNNKTIHKYLKKHQLPYHPLWEKGYVSIGDTHSTKPLSGEMTEEETRFGGVVRECGLHVDTLSGL
ncbi:phosphoadenylyl-sulfate reductase [Kangiella koreensis]|uniref:Phosphoadenosine 5'-phosphosulfate reductase n=1 Tax=Kangiella koreensis (strain DSM 16069 / JCM 12317 / KCTC 12182 / SW-125) TaxID=523791 RepID=C7RA29_KANKD|nr:phosphoadenylyl-sulfate reductase [Kangiella koreensis]ACV26148.1 phosphoadenosine phosphosulfate reductase [Kangiella koreensis DSM 16069]